METVEKRGLGTVVVHLSPVVNIHVGLKPPPPYIAPASTATMTASGLTGLTSKLTTTTTTTPGVGLGLGLPKSTIGTTTVKPGLTGLTTTTATAPTSLTGAAASGAVGGGSGKSYNYKELENLVNKVRSGL